ncbi:hypothetical protein DL89DRAFT_74992 [Linderina pennispora]|uniref:Anaphase-promoting complex subunit 4 n=1 Tax=Linderina pennispora TaxID=61395 RepID=A0A1Y1VXN1_9FUNG|nr:uncharacterized protein DL89DRAFT_74992 [Linderina pennispora]ORX66017.1 hypothetical protein DL89DRAFT_74992 [Linderina pennispora]
MAPLLLLSPSGEPYSTNGFQSLSDKNTLCLRSDNILKHAVSASPQWCPTLDVLAIPEGHALRLVRLSGGQTVWRRLPQDHLPRHAAPDAKKSATDPDLVSALAWHPAGRYIAVVYADGRVVQREPAHGEIIHEAKINLDDDERVVSLQWVKCMSSESNSHMPNQTMDMQLSLPRLAPLRKGEDGPGHINPSTSEDLTAMIAVTSHGTVWMSLYGTFALPLKRVATLDSTVVRACISSDTRKLFIVTSSNDRHESQLSILDTSLLAVSSPLLSELASSSAHLSGLCLHLGNVIESIAKECVTRNEGSSRQTLLDSFESVLRDHGIEEVTSPEAELTRLAVTGRATDSSSQFLLNKFKITRLKSWESAGRPRCGRYHQTRLPARTAGY